MMRYLIIGLILAVGTLGCKDDSKTDSTESQKAEVKEGKEATEAKKTGKLEPTGTLSIDWSFVVDEPIKNQKANAWYYTQGRENDDIILRLMTEELGGVCEYGDTKETISEGQFGLEFRSHSPRSNIEKTSFEGKPAKFEGGGFKINYHSAMSGKPTNSGFSAGDDKTVTIDITEVHDEFIVGTATAGSDNYEITADFTAKKCN